MPFRIEIDVSISNGIVLLNKTMPFRIGFVLVSSIPIRNGILRIWLKHLGSSAHLNYYIIILLYYYTIILLYYYIILYYYVYSILFGS